MRYMSKQEMFNRAWRGLTAQGFQISRDDNDDICVYRDEENNRKCAFGHVLPDADYDVSWEGVGAPQLLTEQAEAGGHTYGTKVLKFVDDLQKAHDTADIGDDGRILVSDLAIAANMQRKLRAVAATYELTVPK
jgi:hypothetical protein